MNRKLFNLKNAAKVAVLTLVAFVGFNSFTNEQGDTKVLVPKEAWYPITVTSDPSFSVQEIAGSPIDGFDVTDPCQETFTGDFCAIRLSFDVAPEAPAPVLPNNTSIDDAISLYGATVILDMSLNPVYARHDE